MSEQQLARVRRMCLALPEATERLSHGEPTFFVRLFAMYAAANNHHGDGRSAVWCKAAPGNQSIMVRMDPDRFFVPPYVGTRGWLGVRLDVPGVDWDQIADLVVDAYRTVAPKKLVERLDA